MKNLIILKIALLVSLTFIVPVMTSCSSKAKIEGTYSQSGSGTVALDLKSGGKATFTMMGDDYACIYKVKWGQGFTRLQSEGGEGRFYDPR